MVRVRHRAAVAAPVESDVAVELAHAADARVVAARRRERHGLAFLVASAILFGVMAVCVRVATRELGPTQVAWVRFTGSFVLLFALARGRRLRPKPGNFRSVMLRGLLGSCAIISYFAAIDAIGAGLATLIQGMYPIPTALIAIHVLGERWSRQLGVAIGLNLLGLALVLGPGASLAGVSPFGIGIALLGALLAGAAVATARHLRGSEDATLITVYFMAVGALFAAPSMLQGVPALGPATVLALVGVVVTSAAGQWLLHHGLGYTSAAVGGLTSATSVLTAAGLGALFLGERLAPASVAGAALMIVSVALATARRG
jgi:drug/metabolite transporter (DMT)-like permease